MFEFKQASEEEVKPINKKAPFNLMEWGIRCGVATLSDGGAGLLLNLIAPDGSGSMLLLFSDTQAQDIHAQLSFLHTGENTPDCDESGEGEDCPGCAVSVPNFPTFEHLLGDVIANGGVPVGVVTAEAAMLDPSVIFVSDWEREAFAKWFTESLEKNGGEPIYGQSFQKSQRD